MKKIFSLIACIAMVFMIGSFFVGCGKTSYKGATYELSEIIMLNNNGSEDTYEEYLVATGITEKQVIDINNYYGIEIKDSSTMKSFLMKYVSASIKFVDDENVVFSYGFNTIQDRKLNRVVRYEFDGIYKVSDGNLSINLLNYEYKKSGEIETTDSGIYKSTYDNKLIGTMFGDLSYNISVVNNKTIKMNLYQLQVDGTQVNNISLVFSKV